MIEILSRKKLAQSLYEKMTDNEMIFNYFGKLNFELSQYLLNNLKISLNETDVEKKYSRKIFSTMVEGIENILRHSSKKTNESNEGIILLTRESDNSFCLTIGNAVDTQQEIRLLENLDEIKDESIESLKMMFKERLASTDPEVSISANLGLIQIAINCDNNIDFDFLPLNNTTQKLFLLNITIK